MDALCTSWSCPDPSALGPPVKMLITNGSWLWSPLGVSAHRRGTRAVLSQQGWSALEKSSEMMPLELPYLWKAGSSQGAAVWSAAVKFIFSTVKELQKGVRISVGWCSWAEPSPVVSRYRAQRKWHMQCVPQKPPLSAENKGSPQSILQLLSHSLWQRDSLS